MPRETPINNDFPRLNLRDLAKFTNDVNSKSVLPGAELDHVYAISGRILSFMVAQRFSKERSDTLAHRWWEQYRYDRLDDKGLTIDQVLTEASKGTPLFEIRMLMRVVTACGDVRKTLERQQQEVNSALLELEALEAPAAGAR